MANFQNGDIVKVTTQNSMHTGKTGVIVYAYGDQESLLVRIDGKDIGFFVSEVEPTVLVEVNLSSVEEDYDVAVNLTPEEARGVGKFIAAAQDAEEDKGIQFGPKLRLRSVK